MCAHELRDDSRDRYRQRGKQARLPPRQSPYWQYLRPQVYLGGASCAFDDHPITLGGQPVKALQNAGQKGGLKFSVVPRLAVVRR